MMRGSAAAMLALLASTPTVAATTAADKPPVTSVAAARAADGATDPDRRAAARRLLDTSGFRDRQKAIAADGWQAARAQLLSECIDRAAAGSRLVSCALTPARTVKVKAQLAAEQDRIFDTLGEAAETLYARQFTAAEMDGLSRFFDSDLGQKYSKAYPSILARFQVAKERLLLAALRDAIAKPGDGAAKPKDAP